jgi:colanic acid biosynthesis glycosyl transferase WcaI
VLFCFIGGGMRRNELLGSFRNKNPENVVFFPFLSNTDYSLSVTACHVAFVTLQKNLTGIAVPSKIFGIMAAGIPVIGIVPRNSEISYIIEEEKCGIVIDPGDTKGLLNALNLLKNNEEIRREMGLNGRKAFLNKYTLSIIAEYYIKMI